MAEKFVCPVCNKFTLKQITSKKNKKKYWVCQGPQDLCKAIFSDTDGKPEFPEENPTAIEFLAWLHEENREASLSEWEQSFVDKLSEEAAGQGGMMYFTSKQIKALREIAGKFVGAPKF